MRRIMSTACVAGVTTALSIHAFAQTTYVHAPDYPNITVPRIFAYCAERPAGTSPMDPYLTAMVFVRVFDDGNATARNGDQAAQVAAQDMLDTRLSGPNADLAPGKVCFSFETYGLDNSRCDAETVNGVNPWVEYRTAPTRFAVDLENGLSDRLKYRPGAPVLSDRQFFGDDDYIAPPISRINDNPTGPVSSRQYRHPFLMNAGYGIGTSVSAPPLKQWTIDFCQQYVAFAQSKSL